MDGTGTERSDILILGGGLIGMTLALSLAEHGISCVLVEKNPADTMLESGFDGRTSAIISSSWNMLTTLGLKAELETQGCAIHGIEVREGKNRKSVDFTPEDGILGMVFENAALRKAVYAKIRAHPLVTLHMGADVTTREFAEHSAHVTLDDGVILSARLIVAADGRNSPTRTAAGINLAQWRYPHSAIVTAITHTVPHRHIAHESFFRAGPFALLPMNDGADGMHRSSVIWTMAESDADGMLKLSGRGFLAEMRKIMGNMLGDIQLAAPRQAYPLGLHHAADMTAHRLALVGDSAHGIHPIAGQGLNLGLRDAAALTEVLVTGARLGLDFGDTQLLNRYARWRSLDTLLVTAATDNLTRLFALPGNIPSSLRNLGLAALQNIPALKTFFIDEARGRSGELPKLLKGAQV